MRAPEGTGDGSSFSESSMLASTHADTVAAVAARLTEADGIEW